MMAEITSPGLFKIICSNPSNYKHVLDQFVVPLDSPIKSIAELKGKRVASGPGIQNVTLAKVILEKNGIANPQMPEVGERYLGTVVKTTTFGAFVSLVPGRDGLVHISKLGNGKRVNKVEDVVNVGSKLQVEIADIDERGKISLIPVVEEQAAEAAPAGEE